MALDIFQCEYRSTTQTMKTNRFAIALTMAFSLYCAGVNAQVSATGNGGAGGAGGSSSGGSATGGSSTNNNTTTGTSSATGGTSNIGAATSNYQGADVTVNYVTPAGATGLKGLAAGVDPNSGHIVTDNNVNYSGTTKIKNTPDVNIGGPASGPCNGLSGGIGVGIPGLAVGGNLSTVDKGCEAREAARIAAMLGRMDVANAILENMEVVVAALKAKAERDARSAAAAAAAAESLAANARRAAPKQPEPVLPPQAARDRESDQMRQQQQAGIEALTRQATMQKVNDNLTFTGKLTQGEEKTPQQIMAENLAAKQAAQAASSSDALEQTVAKAVESQPEARAQAVPPPSAAPVALPAKSADAVVKRPDPQPVASQAVPAKPAVLARRDPDETKDRPERKSKSEDQKDAIRYALSLGE